MSPTRAITALSALSSYVLVAHAPGVLPSSQPSFIGTFVQLWFSYLFLWGFWRVILWPKLFSPLRHLPSPKGGSWWNGQFPRIIKEATGAPMAEWVNTVPHDGIVRYLSLLNSERLIIVSPKALSEVLTTKSYDFAKPDQLRINLSRLLGVGILVAEGDEHKMQRKNLMPAFAFRHVKDLYPVFWDKSREVVQKMTDVVRAEQQGIEQGSAIAKEAVLEVGGWASRVTLDIIGLAGMGQDFGAIQDPNTVLSQAYKKVFKPTPNTRFLAVLSLLFPDWLVKMLPFERNGDIQTTSTTIRDVCRKLVRTKKEKLERKELTDVDILSVALESGGFIEENLVDQLMTFLAAGHETTATAMTWAIYMLCLNPDVQTRLRQEVRELLPSIEGDAAVTSQQIDHMPYLNAVCNEVLRYYPPVPLTFRSAVVDTSICGQFVPKGTQVMLAPWAVNRHDAQWGPDAGKFNPDRWIPSSDNPKSANGGAGSNYAFLTFLHGPRSCIGQAFAKSEFACLLAAWVGRFEFSLNDELEYDEKNMKIGGRATARPINGLYVKTRVVEGW